MPYRLVWGAQLRENAALRQSFFSLAEQIFGISFAEWHRGGYWQQSYLPYALVEGEEVVANVSVNTMEFLRFGERKRYVQLGTVMTAPRFRGQGLARQLLEHVLLEWESCCQGIYLYANDTVLNFYPKFGFQPQEEYAFFFPLSQRPGDFSHRPLHQRGGGTAAPLLPAGKPLFLLLHAGKLLASHVLLRRFA